MTACSISLDTDLVVYWLIYSCLIWLAFHGFPCIVVLLNRLFWVSSCSAVLIPHWVNSATVQTSFSSQRAEEESCSPLHTHHYSTFRSSDLYFTYESSRIYANYSFLKRVSSKSESFAVKCIIFILGGSYSFPPIIIESFHHTSQPLCDWMCSQHDGTTYATRAKTPATCHKWMELLQKQC